MSITVNISTITANTPFEVFYCNSSSGSCVSVATVANAPYQFDVPSPNSDTDFVVKIVDSAGCVDGMTIYVTPTPTPSVTPTLTPSPTVTPTLTSSSSPTPTPTGTIPATPTPTSTITPTPTPSSVVYAHQIGRFTYTLSTSACLDTLLDSYYYTSYIDTPTIPVIGAQVFQNVVGGTLFNPVNQGGLWRKMIFGSSTYAVQIDSSGIIINFIICL